jgi:hypothetical protein
MQPFWQLEPDSAAMRGMSEKRSLCDTNGEIIKRNAVMIVITCCERVVSLVCHCPKSQSILRIQSVPLTPRFFSPFFFLDGL